MDVLILRQQKTFSSFLSLSSQCCYLLATVTFLLKWHTLSGCLDLVSCSRGIAAIPINFPFHPPFCLSTIKEFLTFQYFVSVMVPANRHHLSTRTRCFGLVFAIFFIFNVCRFFSGLVTSPDHDASQVLLFFQLFSTQL